MYPLIDTHTHIEDPVFDPDRKAVLLRAEKKGVIALAAVSETLEDAKKILELNAAHPQILPALGLYPTILDIEQSEKMIELIRNNHSRIAAIGEVGLDYWKVKEEHNRAVQKEIFKSYIDLSLELDLPLNIHSRSAGRHVIDLLLDGGALRVQLHAFDGKASIAMPAIEAGYFFSIPSSIIRSRQKQKLVKKMPLEKLLLETDSPVLSPEPGARNEPANITVALGYIAELKGVSEAELRQVIHENFIKLYGIECIMSINQNPKLSNASQNIIK